MQIESFVLDDWAVHSNSTLSTPLSIDVSTHCLLIPAMTPEIIKVMVDGEQWLYITCKRSHMSACAYFVHLRMYC